MTPAILAEPEALRASAIEYRHRAARSSELSRAIQGTPMPAMPYWVELETRSRIGRSAASLGFLHGELMACAADIERTATLFDESQRSTIGAASTAAFASNLFDVAARGVVPFGTGAVDAMRGVPGRTFGVAKWARELTGRAPQGAIRDMARLQKELRGGGSHLAAARHLGKLSIALDVAIGVNEQLIEDARLTLTPGQRLARGIVGGVIRAAPSIAGATLGTAVGYAAVGLLVGVAGPVVAPAAVLIVGAFAVFGSAGLSRLGATHADRAADGAADLVSHGVVARATSSVADFVRVYAGVTGALMGGLIGSTRIAPLPNR